MGNLVMAVEKDTVNRQINQLYAYLNQANSTRPESTFVTIYDARDKLFMAKGYYQALGGVGLLQNCSNIYEDITRAEERINYLLAEKRRNQLPSWKH